jgi:uncharacterized OB-fold protein
MNADVSAGFPDTEPQAVGLHADWYAANRDAGALTAQRCDRGHWRHPARHRCGQCHSASWTFEAVTPSGVVESWTVTRRPLHFAFAEVLPYALLVVRTPEGPQYLVHLRPALGDSDPPRIGDTVSLRVDRGGVPYAVRD